jgi:hypothetical protein
METQDLKPYLSQSHREDTEKSCFSYKPQRTLFFLCDSSDPKGSGRETGFSYLSQSHREGGEGNLIGFKIRKPSSSSVSRASLGEPRDKLGTGGREVNFFYLSQSHREDTEKTISFVSKPKKTSSFSVTLASPGERA